MYDCLSLTACPPKYTKKCSNHFRFLILFANGYQNRKKAGFNGLGVPGKL